MADQYSTALIVGAGTGLSASIARLFANEGLSIVLAARDIAKLEPLCQQTGAQSIACDATRPADVSHLFDETERRIGSPDVVVYNASARVRGPISALDPLDVERSISVSAFGAFLVAQAAAKRMLPQGRGAIMFTG